MRTLLRISVFVCSIAILQLLLSLPSAAQDATTGQIVGDIEDQTGAVIPNAQIGVKSIENGQVRKVSANAAGHYVAPLLPPGTYILSVSVTGFAPMSKGPIKVPAGTSTTVNLQLVVGSSQQEVTVNAEGELLQTENAANGATADHATVTALPLTNRNFTQILQLSPGVASHLPDAAALGRNTVDVNVNGARVADNSYQLDGMDASNLHVQGTSGVFAESGISIPNPDAIEEFRVQTSQYDASYGRGSGANVDVVTKSGTNQFHGDAFEFLRNTALNANNWFLKRNHQPRPILKQNQFGGVLGGPAIKDKLFFFTSYQRTLQVNGQGGTSLRSYQMPLLGDSASSRTAAALGNQFAGLAGFRGGTKIAADGSNINPVALALIQYKLPNGQWLVPAPQTVQDPKNVSAGGFSAYSLPSTFDEHQAIGNIDYNISSKHRLSAKYFFSRDTQKVAFSTSALPGAGQDSLFENQNLAVHYTDMISPALINLVKVGYHRIYGNVTSEYPVKSSEIGIVSSCDNMPYAPIMSVTGLWTLGGTFNDQQWANTKAYQVGDQISWVHGMHNIRAGGDVELNRLPFADPEVTRGTMSFSSFPDFLLGLSAKQNGTAFSNVNTAQSICGDTERFFHVNDYDLFFQDDLHLTRTLTVNVGGRWDMYGLVSDTKGRFADFWPQLASNKFPASGQSFSGFVVPSNYQGTPPEGVVVNHNKTFATDPSSSNLGPRVGFSWQVPHFPRAVLRGGYGIYFGRSSINDAYQFILDQPFSVSQTNSTTLAALATFQNPWPPAAPVHAGDYPVWIPRTVNSQLTLNLPAPNYEAPRLQQYSLTTQYALTDSTVLQVGYVGTKGDRIVVTRNINQPTLTVNPDSPSASTFSGASTAAANIQSRRRYLGFGTITQAAEIANSNYNALQVSVQQRMRHGLQFGVSYTFSKNLTNATGNGTFPGKGSIAGDAYNLRQNYGPADFDIPHRLVMHFLWEVPYRRAGFGGAWLGGWGLSGVLTLQNGDPLTISSANSGTIYGVTSANAQLCPGSTYSDIVAHGSTQDKIDHYFNANAVNCLPPAIGNGFDWGNTSHNIVRGPGEHNFDASISRTFKVPRLEHHSVQFRAEFYNLTNTPQFANPNTTVTSATFGSITSTALNPRLVQLALKYVF
jgi:hypothetical protein